MTEQEKIQELLKPRYMQINDWPFMGSKYKIGIIFTFNTEVESGIVAAYPHLFKELKWHQERDKKDMPQYIKWVNPGTKEVCFFKVEQWLTNSAGVYKAHIYDPAAYLFIQDITPATSFDYQNYLKQKQ